MASVTLTREELARYGRHLVMPEVGPEGQRRLKAASVLCVGVGGLGSPAALYLAAAGVGRLGLVDHDVVEASNLQRQMLHATTDVGRAKVESARAKLAALNPGVTVETHPVRLSAANALELVARYDLVVDGTDNFAARYLVNDACVLARRPNVHGSVFRFEGQVSVFAAAGGPCYRCLHPEPPAPGLVPGCAEEGVLGVLPGLVGTIQATEAIKLVLGVGQPLVGRVLVVDALAMRTSELRLARDPACPVCGDRPSITGLTDHEEFCAGPAGRDGQPEVEASQRERDVEISVEELKARMDRGDDFVLLDVREPHETLICSIPNSSLMPMAQVPHRLGELDPARDLVVYCRSGHRSAHVVTFLQRRGFRRALNLRGGVLDWIDRVDPTQPKY
jgi:adenylyltransferase/sulfurtransferase